MSSNNLMDNLYRNVAANKSKDKTIMSNIQAKVTSEVSQQIVNISIDDIYEAPNLKEWNNFKPLNGDEFYELTKSIIESNGEIINPIIVVEMPKNNLSDLYDICTPMYEFNPSANRYLLLSGHSRVNAYYHLRKEFGDKYNKINAIVKIGLSREEMQYIIKISNYATRTLSTKERRQSTAFLYRILKDKNDGTNIAKKIANDSGLSLRTVQYNLTVNEKLIPELIEMFDSGKLSVRSRVRLCKLNKSLQKYMYDTYKDKINNKILSHLQPSVSRRQEIDILFKNEVIEDYINITLSIRSDLEGKFRKMVSNWLSRNG